MSTGPGTLEGGYLERSSTQPYDRYVQIEFSDLRVQILWDGGHEACVSKVMDWLHADNILAQVFAEFATDETVRAELSTLDADLTALLDDGEAVEGDD